MQNQLLEKNNCYPQVIEFTSSIMHGTYVFRNRNHCQCKAHCRGSRLLTAARVRLKYISSQRLHKQWLKAEGGGSDYSNIPAKILSTQLNLCF